MKTAFKLTAYTIVLFLAVAMVASSCKKEESSPTRIKTITHTDTQGNNPVTETYFYDNADRLSSITVQDSLVTSYRYNDLTVIETYGDQNNVYAINKDGYTTSINFYYDVLATITYDGVPGEYTYRKEGNGTETAFTWAGGNLVYTDLLGGVNLKYLSDKTNTIGNENTGRRFLGKDSKNLVDTETYLNASTTITYQYEYDAQNRVTKRSNGTAVEIYTYY